MSSISLNNSWLLLIAVPLLLIILIPFFISVRHENRNMHNVLSCVLHIVMACLVAFAAAGVTIETTLTETDVYVLADVSYSANSNLDVVDSYIKQLDKNLPKNSQMGVICFGYNYQVVTRLGEKFTTVKNSSVDTSQTNITSVLDYAGKIFKSNVIKRLVLITDGRQTTSSDAELKTVVDSLLAKNIYIDAIYLDDNISDDTPEVQISDATFAETVYKGQSSTISLSVQSTQQAQIYVDLYDNDTNEALYFSDEPVSVTPGINDVSLEIPNADDREGGTYNYRAEISSGADYDTSQFNNTYVMTQTVVDKINVMLITESTKDEEHIRESLEYDEDDESFGSIELKVFNPRYEEIPHTLGDLLMYDIIILSDIRINTITHYTEFIDSLEIAVSELGKTFLAFGDLGLDDLGTDEYLQKLSDMLPVTYGSPSKSGVCFTLLIDCSASLSTFSMLQYEKDVAKAIVNLLSSDDRVIIYEFYSDYEKLWDGQPGDDAIATIDGITLKQGTSMVGALEAVKDASATTMTAYSSSALFFITDGVITNDNDSEDKLKSVAEDFYNMGIPVNVFGVTNNQNDNLDGYETVLNNMAQAGGGKYRRAYAVDEDTMDEYMNDLKADYGATQFTGVSAVNVSNKYINDATLDYVRDNISSANTLKTVTGYMISRAKTSADTVLTTTYKDPQTNVSSSVPIYSYWNYGNGISSSFTSKIDGEWTETWVNEGILKKFLTGVLASTIPESQTNVPFTVSYTENNGTYTVIITPCDVKANRDVSVSVLGGNVTVSSVVFTSSYYTCSFPVYNTGTYEIMVSYDYEDEIKTYTTYFSIPYLKEYDAFATYSPALLYRLFGSSGTVSEDGDLVITNDEENIGMRYLDLTIPILATAAVLFIVDIVVRKIKWVDILSLFGIVNDKQKKNTKKRGET